MSKRIKFIINIIKKIIRISNERIIRDKTREQKLFFSTLLQFNKKGYLLMYNTLA